MAKVDETQYPKGSEWLASWREDEIVCPHCFYKYEDSWEYNDDNDTEQECIECGKEFTLEVEFEVRYSTTKIED